MLSGFEQCELPTWTLYYVYCIWEPYFCAVCVDRRCSVLISCVTCCPPKARLRARVALFDCLEKCSWAG